MYERYVIFETDFLESYLIFDAIMEHRRAYYALNYVSYNLLNPATIIIMITKKKIEALKAYYADMRRFFIYGKNAGI